ncbi:hypothetical protein BTR23_17240 [Alkalihalophilus pseudofirmus]|nr:hypothetical protein BTR23_17240 [Alkalihalophilus pseudofirmus]
MKKVILFFVLMTLLLVTVACGSSEENQTEENGGNDGTETTGAEGLSDISFGAATVGGFWYTLAGAMAEDIQATFPGSSVTVVEGGSVSNILGLEQEIYAIGFSNGQTVPEALEGLGEFKEPIENVSTIGTLYPNVMHIVVPKNSNIHSVEDLAGKRVSPGIRGYSGELAFIDILEAYGMSYDDLAHIEYIGTSDGADLLRDGHIDVLVGMLSAPVSTIQELDTTFGVRLIPIDQSVVDELHEKNPGYLDFTIEADAYSNINEDTKTIAGFTVLLANNNLISEEAGYELTKMLVENRDKWETLSSVMKDFNAEYSIENNVGDLHPGAERYYKEIGVLE